ncbi:MAG: UvrD-helicase domain-containing protein [Candidatus Eisenbacteria bacterium]
MDRRELVDRRDRDRASTDLSKNYIVEAAAGTGKTTTLVSRIVNLVTGKRAAPDNIVAITFTERAAAELKAKLRERLAGELSGGPGDCAAHVEEALRGLERMQVTTIHSFSAALLKERPVEAGVDPGFEVADEIVSTLIAEEVWQEWLSRHMDGDDPDLRHALLLGMTLEHMRGLAQTMRGNRDVLDLLPRARDIGSEAEDFVGAFGKILDELKTMTDEHCTSAADKAALHIKELTECARELAKIKDRKQIEAFIFTQIRFRSTGRLGNKGNWSPAETLGGVREKIEEASETHSNLALRIGHNALATLMHRLLDYISAYERAKANKGVLDFHDLLILSRAMLRDHAHVRDYFRKRYKYLLVDEFQDTDPLQAEIIFFLSEEQAGSARTWEDAVPAPGRLFLVGDPKQSIYRFRRADIEMYASAKAKLGKGALLSIHQNFRCVPSIVAVVNSIFSGLIRPPEDGAYQPDYVPLHFGRAEETLPPEHGVVLVYPPESVRESMTSAEERRTYESRCIAALIREMVGGGAKSVWDAQEERLRPVMLKDIAILLRAQTGLDTLEDALRLHEVDYRVIGGKHFFMRQEVQQLLAVLRSIENPYDTIALIAALRSPFFGISDDEIFMHHARAGGLNYLRSTGNSTPAGEALNLLASLHEIRNDVSVEALLHKLYCLTDAPVTYLLKPNGEQRVANLLKLADIARALYERGVYTLRGFVSWLSEREEEQAEESEAVTVEAGDDFVRILTVHKAKGLEFPVVILTDLAKMPYSRSERFILDRADQQIGVLAGSKSDGVRTENYETLSDFEDKRSQAEEQRLLYVAMTRARDFLVIPAYWMSDRETTKDGTPRPGSLLSYIADKLPDAETAMATGCPEGMMLHDASGLDLEPGTPPPFRLKVGRSGTPGAKTAAKELARWQDSQDSLAASFERGRALVAATEGVHLDGTAEPGEGVLFGNLVHRLLEVIDWERRDGLESAAESEGQALGASPSMIAKAAKMVNKALASDLIDRIRRSDRYFKEVPFAFGADGTIIEGKMDVVFVEGDRITVVDFKTDKVSRPDLKHKAETYRTQADTYARAIHSIFARPPHEVILFFLHLMEPVAMSNDD